MFKINEIVEYMGRKAYIYELWDDHCDIRFLDGDKEITSVYYYNLDILETKEFNEWVEFKELYELKKKVDADEL